MLPDNMELQTPQTKEWPLIPEDVYQTEITNIEYKVEKNTWKDREKDPVKKAQMPDEKQVINFEFTIIEEGPHYGRKVWQKMTPIKPYPPYANGKSTWVYHLASVMEGHPITKDEADHFGAANINAYIHRQVRLTVKHSAPNPQGKQYSNVESFLTVKQELPLFDETKVPKENQPAAQNTQAVEKPTEQQKSSPGADSSVSQRPDDVLAEAAKEVQEDEHPF